MITKRFEGGNAFPCGSDLGPASNIVDGGYGGMTLRDWFAGQAMAAMVGCYVEHDDSPDAEDSGVRTRNSNHGRELLIDGGDGPKEIAEDAYHLADAMIAERNKP